MAKTDLQQEWEQRLKEFHASGETATAWCAARNINLSRFWYWSRKLRTQRQKHSTEEIQWLSVRMDEPSSEENTLPVQVGSVRIEVRFGFNSTLLQEVVRPWPMLNEGHAEQKVYLAAGATDMRKSIDGLAALVQEGFHLNTLFSLFIRLLQSAAR